MKRFFDSAGRVKSFSHHEYLLSLFISSLLLMMLLFSTTTINATSSDNNLAPTYKLETIAGGNLGDGYNGLDTPIGHPHAIAFYPRTIPTPLVNLVEDERPQDLIIIDRANNLIRKLTYNWTGVIVDPEQEVFDNIPTVVSTIAGVAASGSSSNENTDGLPANTVKLTNPNTVTVSLMTVVPTSVLARHSVALSRIACAYYDKTTDSWKTDRVTTTILSSQQGATASTYSVVCSTTHWPSSFALIAQPITPPTSSSGKTPQPTPSPNKPTPSPNKPSTSSNKPTSSSAGTIITEKGDKSYIVVLVGFILMIIIAIVIGVGYYIYKKKQGQTAPQNQNDGNGNYATLAEEP
ncbi:predicted protein [Naegleria gruberi]|uniref:Predicted protein n=1 Tax=Naegleria gruberi TaxID=5762 RepID=D2W4N1_NAEGR|nr:uncharacterized protein NAEGRDRAFT_82325 [Naegleria gruberi]EFC35971.1 predicted protein [Naegleria gruberi]|eukprot:XP_002668715.1 predicted protein [Naegleria gruberi strain NEG-M]